MQSTGIIMAGGKSSRMGTNKALLPIGGKTVIERIVMELNKIVSNIVIVTNTFEDYQFLRLPMVKDIWKDMGPLAGIHAGLSASSTEKNLIVACDMPFISSQLGGILLTLLDDYQVAVPHISGQLHPLFAAYRKDTIGEVHQSLQNQELRIRQFFKHTKTKFVTEACLQKLQYHYQEQHFFNMNHQEDFERAVKMESDFKLK
ncbi:molybdenum cofactor guanylyltransferase [Bacillus sp. DTU_2020_1000418_1_SI_GHA_SEK_038]|uniref:molybdenum cofactor guanylyltransferase n=1 Tax=Bacillus sp. DTU_2020_1000418_1_SI_GHA_SEK_038 TaxID=3077585 RepID=UPI0028EFC6B2|nr:molybdenum cofactor guanylyltransferase [Bacillus sp. DTU_2020_1000418_1_SI_GHA_SEK_038]WNS75333.1 molybdenum cofactor guanylyltransferase [Bacillus sp. DTU_2020_1000418_1_SI_GHA_SEK_038]